MGIHLPKEIAQGLLNTLADEAAFIHQVGRAIRDGHLGKERASHLIYDRHMRRDKLIRKLRNVVKYTTRQLSNEE